MRPHCLRSFFIVGVCSGIAHSHPFERAAAVPSPPPVFETSIGDLKFVNKGLVAFGLIPSNATELNGDTIGGIGSAIALKPGSFTPNDNGTFSGTMIVQPDRGFNVDGTIDYQARQLTIDFTLNPYYGTNNLSFEDAQKTMLLEYRSTLFYTDENGVRTTGLDALANRNDSGFVEFPAPSLTVNDLSLDVEGLAILSDGSFWSSDEYGPYIYKYSPKGELLEAVQPPNAILPFLNGSLNFTSKTNPDTGRADNQGFEGLTIAADESTLFALLQSATMQDGGTSDQTNRYTRLLSYDITSSPAKLVGEWVVPLPQTSKGKTIAANEVHFISPTIFLILTRDSLGHGGDDGDPTSKHKNIDLIDISNATNISGMQFDNASSPIAPDGLLDPAIIPAEYFAFVDLLDATQLSRFGLHNGDPVDETLIDAKWESIAIAPAGDKANPDDYFLFTFADNDFMSTQGVFNNTPFDAGVDNDNQVMVYLVTLPNAQV